MPLGKEGANLTDKEENVRSGSGRESATPAGSSLQSDKRDGFRSNKEKKDLSNRRRSRSAVKEGDEGGGKSMGEKETSF